MPADAPLFELDGVGVAGTDRPRLAAVSVVIGGGVTGVVGPSGSGKSTLLRCLNRLEVPERGVVRHHGVDLADLDPVAVRRRVGMVFQRPTPFDGTVLDNLRVADPGLDERSGADLLRRAHLPPPLLARSARELSGGEAQRMCLARTLATRPEVLLLDEPTSALDATARDALEALVADLVADGLDAVWVSHDVAQLERVADEVIVLVAGRVVQVGPARSLRADAPPDVARYLGGCGAD